MLNLIKYLTIILIFGFLPAEDFYLQEAIDAAAAGDVINIPSGTYVGPFTIDKSLTLDGGDKDLVFIENADITADVLLICYFIYFYILIHVLEFSRILELGGSR